MSPLAGKGTWCLVPATPAMLPTATKHFDRAAILVYDTVHVYADWVLKAANNFCL